MKKKFLLFGAAPALICAALLAGCGAGETTPVPEAQTPTSSAAEVSSAAPTTSTQSTQSTEITVEQAKQIAADDAKLTDPVYTKAAAETDDGVQIFDVEMVSGNNKYDYEIDAKTGTVRERETDLVVNPTTAQEGHVTPEAAVKSAEQAANLTDGILTKNHLEQDDGQSYYEIEIVKDGMKYEFEVDAATGSVLEQETDRDD